MLSGQSLSETARTAATDNAVRITATDERGRRRPGRFKKITRWRRRRVVGDNFSPRKKSQIIDLCADHDVELVFTPRTRPG